MKRLASVVLVCALPLGCRPNPPAGPPPLEPVPVTFAFAVDPVLAAPGDSFLDAQGAAQPVGAYADGRGVVTRFIANELVVKPASPDELDALVARLGATVLGNDAVPEPPAQLGRTLTDAERAPRRWRLRVPTADVSTDDFLQTGSRRGMTGSYRISSEAGAQLLALVARERAAGLKVAPNFLTEPAAMLFRTEEGPGGFGVTGYWDAFSAWQFNSRGTLLASSVSAAWQFVTAHGFPRRINLAVLDRGFWLDAAGHPVDDIAGTRADLPDGFAQYDFVDDDYTAGGPGLPGPAQWHGTMTASVAAGGLDNQRGAAGTGGLVASPILFRRDDSVEQERRAVRTAVAWGADVLSMSFGGACNDDCLEYNEDSEYDAAFAEARAAGVVLVAAAGNSGEDSGANHFTPCSLDGVICVGALRGFTADPTAPPNVAISYSNFGAPVDLWAPTNIPSQATPTTAGKLDVGTGTSASTPFVAGVAALMKAMDPTLTSDGVRALLLATAHRSSPDPKVTATLNAFGAVAAAAKNQLPADPSEAGSTPEAMSPGTLSERTLHDKTDVDVYRMDLADYAAVKFDLKYMRPLGLLWTKLTPDLPTALATEVESSSTDEGFSYRALLAPGRYFWRLSTDVAQRYQPALTFTSTGLAADRFESNDTFATATALAEGSYAATLHTAGDVDLYAVDVTLTPPLVSYAFEVTSADMDVTLQQFNAAGAVVATSGPAARPGLMLPSGHHVIKVSAPSRGRYLFTAAGYVDPALFPLHVPRAKLLVPNVSSGGVLEGPEDFRVFNKDSQLNDLRVVGKGLHFTVSDGTGAEVGAGAKFSLGESLSISSLPNGKPYLMHLTRDAAPELGSDAASLGAVSYDVKVGFAP